jgi:hypothetical protein
MWPRSIGSMPIDVARYNIKARAQTKWTMPSTILIFRNKNVPLKVELK